MGQIPQDAIHWDSGDWIEWHRSTTGLDDRPCTAAAQDTLARLTALHVSLLRAASGYFRMTGHHLPVYREIAHTYVAIHCDLPFEGPLRSCADTGIEIMWLEPHAADSIVHVDLTLPFNTLIVVRINDNFKPKAAMIQRGALPDSYDGLYPLSWRAIPHKL
ncbi:MAG: hypothetical protein WBV78_20105 [Roseobacter sp.]|jgi:hypothetical protein